MLDSGEAAGLGLELAVLQVHEGGHLVAGVAVGQIEHGVVEGVEAGQGDELELEAHGAQLVLELGDLVVVQVGGPLEGRGAVVGQELVRELGADALGELLGELEIRGTGLHPDHVGVRSEGLRTGDAGLDAVLDVVVALGGALTGEELVVALVNVGGQQGSGLGVGAGDDDGRGVGDVGGQTGGVQGTDVLLGRDEDLAAQVAALLLGGQLVLPVGAGGAGLDHGLLQLVDIQGATEAGLTVGDDRDEPVVDGGVTLDAGDLVGAGEGVVDALDHGRNGVRRVQGLVGVGVAGEVSVTGNLPTGEVDGLQAGADLLDGLVTGQGTQGVDVAVARLVDGVPEDLSTTRSEGVLLNDGALELGNLLGGVVAGDVGPTGVLVPVLLDFGGGTRLSDVRHVLNTLP